MRIHDPELRNMAHALSLSIFIAFKGTNFYIFIFLNILKARIRLCEMMASFTRLIL